MFQLLAKSLAISLLSCLLFVKYMYILTHRWKPCQADHRRPDLYSHNNNNSLTKSKIVQKRNEQLKNSRVGGWVGRSSNGGQQKTTACLYTSHDLNPSPGPSSVWEKHFPLISFHWAGGKSPLYVKKSCRQRKLSGHFFSQRLELNECFMKYNPAIIASAHYFLLQKVQAVYDGRIILFQEGYTKNMRKLCWMYLTIIIVNLHLELL